MNFSIVNIRCKDNGVPSLSIDTTVTIPIGNVNEKPSFINIDNKQTLSAPENLNSDYVLGALLCNDPDKGQIFTYELQGNSTKYFKVDIVDIVIVVYKHVKANKLTTLFQRCNNVVDVQTTLLQRQNDVVCLLGC